MWSRRQEADYCLQRRNALRALRNPLPAMDAWNAPAADPLLLRVTGHQGTVTDVARPASARNHPINSYLLGDGARCRPPRRQPTVEDIYG